MEALSLEEMASIEGGFNWGCAAAIGLGVLLVAGLSVNPIGDAWAVAVYVTGATAGPTVVGLDIGFACSK